MTDKDALRTALCERLGIALPIIQAPMGGAVGPAMAAAVSNAGALGMLAMWRGDIDVLRQQVRETRALTSQPIPMIGMTTRAHGTLCEQPSDEFCWSVQTMNFVSPRPSAPVAP